MTVYVDKKYMIFPSSKYAAPKRVFLYEDGELVSCDNEEEQWTYYNCNGLTYGDKSMEENLPR